MRKKNNLFAVHLNEFNFSYLKKGAFKYNKKNIIELLKLQKVSTYTKDKFQNKNLDPWVQSVSINTGKTSSKHKILNLGDNLDARIVQIWDILSKKEFTCSIWGTMNSKLNYNKNIKLYFPDPWNFKDQIYPKALNKLFVLPKYFSKNYTDVSILKIFLYGAIFFISSIRNGCSIFYLKNIFLFTKLLLTKGVKNYLLFFIFDLISLHIFNEKIKKNRTNFSLIFLNSLAHFQHNNWDEKENEKYYFLFADLISEYILKISQNYNSILIYNGFSQDKIKTEFLLRPINPVKFLKKLNINFKTVEQDMTNGAMIFFKNKKDFLKGKAIISNFKVFGMKAFKITREHQNSFFYKIQIKSFYTIDSFSISKINASNVKKFVNYYEKKKFSFTKSLKLINEEFFFKNVNFIKCTGKHNTTGIILKKNFNIKPQIKIENHKLFNMILGHFSLAKKK